MKWEQWHCSNQACAREVWMVQRDPTARDLWRVAAPEDGCPFTLAAIDPVCPRCGTTLLGMVELTGWLSEAAGAEDGLIFDFLHSVA